jgi:hypothetical protein
MRKFLKASGGWARAVCFWPLALLALPNCTLDSNGTYVSAFVPGSPASSAIMCDIPKPNSHGEGNGECATQDDVDAYNAGFGISLSQAATALASGKSSGLNGEFVLDWSESAVQSCGGKFLRKIEFFGNYPDGLRVCLNCGQIPAVYPSNTKACIAKCKDLVTATSDGTVDASSYCAENARTSTNHDPDICYLGACTDGGNPWAPFEDPRRNPELVKWVDHSGTEDFGGSNSLKRIADTTGNTDDDFNAGAASGQLIAGGDAWVEFEAGQVNVSHVLGVRESCADLLACPDTDYSLQNVGFGIRLNDANQVQVVESGTVHGPFGLPYVAGERFRIKVTDNHAGTATISYSRLVGTCVVGTDCTEDVFYTHVGSSPVYPLRVDATFREKDATLVNVTLVRVR